MTASTDLAVNLLDAHSLLRSFGTIGIFIVLLAETGILVGLFLPGDSLLFTAGLLAATGAHAGLHLSLAAVMVAAAAGALVGAQLGFLIGRRIGPALVERPARRRLHHGVVRAGEYLQKYGPAKAVILARFIPVVRTVINPIAGITGMGLRTFTLAQVVGGLGWSLGVTLAGYGLGSRIPNIDHYLLPLVALVVLLSLIPIGLEVLRVRRRVAS